MRLDWGTARPGRARLVSIEEILEFVGHRFLGTRDSEETSSKRSGRVRDLGELLGGSRDFDTTWKWAFSSKTEKWPPVRARISTLLLLHHGHSGPIREPGRARLRSVACALRMRRPSSWAPAVARAPVWRRRLGRLGPNQGRRASAVLVVYDVISSLSAAPVGAGSVKNTSGARSTKGRRRTLAPRSMLTGALVLLGR